MDTTKLLNKLNDRWDELDAEQRAKAQELKKSLRAGEITNEQHEIGRMVWTEHYQARKDELFKISEMLKT